MTNLIQNNTTVISFTTAEDAIKAATVAKGDAVHTITETDNGLFLTFTADLHVVLNWTDSHRLYPDMF